MVKKQIESKSKDQKRNIIGDKNSVKSAFEHAKSTLNKGRNKLNNGFSNFDL